jgi:hypothetical protein
MVGEEELLIRRSIHFHVHHNTLEKARACEMEVGGEELLIRRSIHLHIHHNTLGELEAEELEAAVGQSEEL